MVIISTISLNEIYRAFILEAAENAVMHIVAEAVLRKRFVTVLSPESATYNLQQTSISKFAAFSK